MALNDKILNNFFEYQPNLIKNEKDSCRKYSKFRVFDNPEDIKNKLNTNSTQTEHKENTNSTQTGHETKHKVVTNSTQTKHNKIRYRENLTQSEHKLHTELNTKVDTNSTQIKGKPNTNYLLSTLVGLQRKCLFFIYNSCKKLRSNVSEPLTIEYISRSLNIKKGSVKTTLTRLSEKKILMCSSFKNGRGGWSSYEIPEVIFKELILLETEHKLYTKLNTEVDTSLNSSSININTTTTNDDDAWNLDINSLEHIGFTKKHLEQIAKKSNQSPENVQEAIHAFSYDLENKKTKIRNGNDPLSFFMGIMNKGGLYLPVSVDYINPTLKAAKIYIDKRKERNSFYKELDNELRMEHFEEWNSNLSDQEKETILPEKVRKSGIKMYIHSTLLSYHGKMIWPEVRKVSYSEKNLPLVDFGDELEIPTS